jgi:hypothetical protein
MENNSTWFNFSYKNKQNPFIVSKDFFRMNINLVLNPIPLISTATAS